jgi:excisionase family DNA binding protein
LPVWNEDSDGLVGKGGDMVAKNQMEPMLTVREVASLLNIHSNTVRRWSERGIIRAYRISRRGDRRFRREDIARFLAELNVNRDNYK